MMAQVVNKLSIYDLEFIPIGIIALLIFFFAIRRARQAPPQPLALRWVRYGKAFVGLGWLIISLWLLFNLPTGDFLWFSRTFIWPGIFATLSLTLMALIEC